LKKGDLVTQEMLTVKRPGVGIPAAELGRVIGRIVVREVGENCVLRWEDVGGEA
jgi:N,N'-diacetyllegionaminate synthase